MSLVDLTARRLDSRTASELKRMDADEYSRIHSRSSMRKGYRPWELVDTTSGLDTAQPWIGMEWENGFRSLEKYQAAVDFVWAAYHNITVDAEGPGPWYGEFTFAPQNYSDFVAGTTPFDGLLNFMIDTDNRMPLSWEDLETRGTWVDPSPHPEHGARPGPHATWCEECDAWHTNEDVSEPNMERWRGQRDLRAPWGIHVNISIPEVRPDILADRTRAISEQINGDLRTLSIAQRTELFGRQPYGFCFPMGGASVGRWWEFKLFRTTDDPEAIAVYKRTIDGLVSMLKFYASKVADRGEWSGIYRPSANVVYKTLKSGAKFSPRRCTTGDRRVASGFF